MTTTTAFENFARTIVERNADHLLNDGPDEQTARAVHNLWKFSETTPILPVYGVAVDLAGFGEAPAYFAGAADDGELYLLLSEVAEQLGMPPWKACAWARQQHLWAIEDQRREDEERGDGRLGYDCLRDLVNLGFDFIADDPEAKPDATGRRWSSYGDWLIAQGRLPALLSVSPWGREFIDNISDHMSIGMRKLAGDQLHDVKTYDTDGNPTGGTAATDLFHTDLTEAEALRKARRGPAAPTDR
ncbi:hypothetical protein NE235_10630 [Actinoallomurus spadix]|uniref:Uncharacterized protein n=1 Tax=Actinoallomurus spadix TaxID=79912 RepID=A0ABN0WVE1_9ACTN|nr:hypothetical protein [Actinoallomurus spadix]MCO5986557.1 hypothetical protein [Actinoallomurus spadix]